MGLWMVSNVFQYFNIKQLLDEVESTMQKKYFSVGSPIFCIVDEIDMESKGAI